MQCYVCGYFTTFTLYLSLIWQRYLNILIWAINFIIKSITRSFIILNTMMESENTSFANISTPFLRPFSQHFEHDLMKEIEALGKLVFSFSIILFNMIKLLVILFIMEVFAMFKITVNINIFTCTLSRDI